MLSILAGTVCLFCSNASSSTVSNSAATPPPGLSFNSLKRVTSDAEPWSSDHLERIKVQIVVCSLKGAQFLDG